MQYYAIRLNNGKYTSTGSQAQPKQVSLYASRIFDNIEDAVAFYWKVYDYYFVCGEGECKIVELKIEHLNTFEETRKLISKLNVLIERIYKVIYKLKDGKLYEGSYTVGYTQIEMGSDEVKRRFIIMMTTGHGSRSVYEMDKDKAEWIVLLHEGIDIQSIELKEEKFI